MNICGEIEATKAKEKASQYTCEKTLQKKERRQKNGKRERERTSDYETFVATYVELLSVTITTLPESKTISPIKTGNFSFHRNGIPV